MSPCHVQIDSLYFHIMKASLLTGKQITLSPSCLQKHKRYDLKQSIPSIRGGLWSSSSPLFCLYKMRVGGILIKIDIHLVEI